MKMMLLLVSLFVFIEISTQDLTPEELCAQPGKLSKFWKCSLRNLPPFYKNIFSEIGECVMNKKHFTSKGQAIGYYICSDEATQAKFAECLANNIHKFGKPTESEVKKWQYNYRKDLLKEY